MGAGPGRPRVYCRDSHRQRAYEARKLASAHRLGEDDVLLSRASFQELKDVVFVIEAGKTDQHTLQQALELIYFAVFGKILAGRINK